MDVVDVGLPGLTNLTSHAVRLRKISMVSVPPAVRLLSVTAHTGAAVGIVNGDLTKLCRRTYPSHPLTDAVTSPHADSNWKVVLAMTFTKPGRYYLPRVKIYYTTDGHNGWQYQNLFTTLYLKAAHPGDKPRFDGCP